MKLTELFLGLHCKACNFKYIESFITCPECGSENLEAVTLSGKGVIYTFTIVHVGFGHMAELAPYVLAIIETEEKVMVTTLIEGIADFSNIRIGLDVKFDRIEEKIGPVFRLA